MARVKGGFVRTRRRKRILKLAKGYFGSKHRLFKTAKEQVGKSLLWIVRINAAARINGLTYSKFMHGLKLAGVEVNRKMLADLAVNDIASFNALATVAKDKLSA